MEEWEVVFTDEFETWFRALLAGEQEKVASSIDLIAKCGPTLRHPHSSKVNGSRHGGMRELRVQVGGAPYRVLYAFDPSRAAVLLLGGDKTGDNRWYKVNVPIADRLFDEHLAELKKEEKKDG